MKGDGLNTARGIFDGVLIVIVLWVIILFPLTCEAQPEVIKKLCRFFTHPKVVAVLDYTSSYLHVWYDSNTDAVTWNTIYGSGNLHGKANIYNWHYNKNMARFFLAVKGYAVGCSVYHVMTGQLDWKRLYRREFRMMPAMMTVWRMNYTRNRYGRLWDTSAEHNKTRYVIPLPGADIKIPLYGWQVSLANSLELSISSYYTIKDIYGGKW